MSDWTEESGVFTIRARTQVQAPVERCFDLSCSIALVKEELGMTPVEGRTTGLVQDGDTVRWQGWQLGLPQFHVTLISGYQRPTFLQDTMLKGRFKHFQHDHHLRRMEGNATELYDELRFSLPFGIAGRLVARWIMVPHIRGLMSSRFARIRRIAESDDWRRYITDSIPAAA